MKKTTLLIHVAPGFASDEDCGCFALFTGQEVIKI
jgi:hypothetical protein